MILLQSAQKKIIVILIILTMLFASWILNREYFRNLLADTYMTYKNNTLKQNTSPLSLDVAQDLCKKFEIPDSDFRCQGRDAYALDFYPKIIKYYSTVPKNARTQRDVQEKIGKYQIIVKKVWVKNVTYYWHLYDFTGDQTYPLLIVFNENGVITDLRYGPDH
jgi:hypothetical protein